MTTFVMPAKEKLPALIALSNAIKRGEEIPLDANQRISDLLGVPLCHYTTSVDYALRLRDIVYGEYSYVNIDTREYNDGRGIVVLTKIETEYNQSNGNHHTRAGALLDAMLKHIICELEDDDYDDDDDDYEN